MLDNISMAVASLKNNKMRSFLTMLGIVIGIASVIAIMTVGDSMNASMKKSMSEMGANNISFYVTAKTTDDTDNATVREMKDKDYVGEEVFTALQERYSDRLDGIVLSKSVGQAETEVAGKKSSLNITGLNSFAVKCKKLTILAGRSFDRGDFQNNRKTALVSSKYAEKMYENNEEAVGKVIDSLIDGKFESYTIIGVYEHKQSADDYMQNAATECYIPLKTAFAFTNKAYQFSDFEAVAKTGVDSQALTQELTNYINNAFYKENDTYQIEAYSMKEMIQESEKMVSTLKLAMSAIAAISLLVGGIGVMNIMVVSITERTREIGTRKALGATNTEIRLQFITESIVMCMIGGVIGILIGLVLGAGASQLMQYPAVPSVKGILISVLFSAVFGIFFGYYPANKAAKMNPIEALRYE